MQNDYNIKNKHENSYSIRIFAPSLISLGAGHAQQKIWPLIILAAEVKDTDELQIYFYTHLYILMNFLLILYIILDFFDVHLIIQ